MTAVYRCFDSEDRLLYVGCSDDVRRRLWKHSSSGAVWFPDMVRHEVEEFPTRAEALQQETLACQVEGPLYNVYKVPGRRPQPRTLSRSWVKSSPSFVRSFQREDAA